MRKFIVFAVLGAFAVSLALADESSGVALSDDYILTLTPDNTLCLWGRVQDGAAMPYQFREYAITRHGNEGELPEKVRQADYLVVNWTAEKIPAGFFRDFKSLEVVCFLGRIGRIEPEAFSGCTNLSDVLFMSASEMDVASNAFENCASDIAATFQYWSGREPVKINAIWTEMRSKGFNRNVDWRMTKDGPVCNRLYLPRDSSFELLGDGECEWRFDSEKHGDQRIIDVPASYRGIPVVSVKIQGKDKSRSYLLRLPDTVKRIEHWNTDSKFYLWNANKESARRAMGGSNVKVIMPITSIPKDLWHYDNVIVVPEWFDPEAFAENGCEFPRDGDFLYLEHDNAAVIVGYAGKGEKQTIAIPGKVGELPVAEISDCVMAGMQRLEKVTLPSSLKRIGNLAFYECRNLASIEGVEGLESVGKFAFWGTKVKKLDGAANCIFDDWAFDVNESNDEMIRHNTIFSGGAGMRKD